MSTTSVRSINVSGETSVYKRDCGQFVPKPVAATKTDWREASAVSPVKPKKQAPQQQMSAVSAPSHPQGEGPGNGGYRSPSSVPVVSVSRLSVAGK
jgi:hypothetical protein